MPHEAKTPLHVLIINSHYHQFTSESYFQNLFFKKIYAQQT